MMSGQLLTAKSDQVRDGTWCHRIDSNIVRAIFSCGGPCQSPNRMFGSVIYTCFGQTYEACDARDIYLETICLSTARIFGNE